MAQYVVLIYENESDYATASPEVYGEVMEAHNRFAKEVTARGGKIAGGNALQGTDTATSIRGDVVTDGPFVETKEALGGFYLIEADDLDQAIAQVNDSFYGLQTGVFTNDLEHSWRAFNELEVGGVIVNDVPTYRIDHMPYGGVKDSGLGREGLRWSIEDMTELRLMVVAQPD